MDYLAPQSLDPIALCNFLGYPFKHKHETQQLDQIKGFRARFNFCDLRTWFTRQSSTQSNSSQEQIPELRFVPSRRSRRLTAGADGIPCDDATSTRPEGNDINCQSGSALFILPLEIRIMIFEILLCPLSIELNLEYSPLHNPVVSEWQFWHKMIDHPTFHPDFGLLQTVARSPIRRQFPSLERAAKYLKERNEIKQARSKIAGPFLRVCRKVYSEAIHLLYKRNTFVFRSDLILREVDKFFVPTHLSLISSIELVWRLEHEHQPPESVEARRSYEDLWVSLNPISLPSLRRLCVTIDPPYQNRHSPGHFYTQTWLDPVVTLASTRRLDYLEFAIPKSYFVGFTNRAVSKRVYHLRIMLDPEDHIWCNFGGFDDGPRPCFLLTQSFAPGEPIHDVDCQGCLPSQSKVAIKHGHRSSYEYRGGCGFPIHDSEVAEDELEDELEAETG